MKLTRYDSWSRAFSVWLILASKPSVVFSRTCAWVKLFCPNGASGMLGSGMNASSFCAIGLMRPAGIDVAGNAVRPVPFIAPVVGS